MIFPYNNIKLFLRKFSSIMTKSALIIGSNGSEDIELIVTSDVLRRAGVNVTIAGLQDENTIICARKAKLHVDVLFKDIIEKEFDAIVLPGGQPGSDNLAKDHRVGKLLQHHEKAGKIVAAICAAPIAFVSHGIAKNGTLTSYPSVKEKIADAGYNYSENKVCVWKNVVTSRGPGTAFDFAIKLAEMLTDEEKAESVKKALLYNI
ncbi:DJ-1_PfpI domain-containing protein [Meloidogyne graminicola]|uniref:D-lactate dehydratase n=1 Tax=Meloidogyne graminicola TaxID=189291 RepID=A0A8S9ZHH8_9BILA|nr:DJ-1_PfpI domain-containing protein [Meloidogyne graminicola]